MSDLETLKEMGFDEEKAAMAVKKGGNLQGAIDWLDTNQEKSLEDLKADEEEDAGMPSLPAGENARSLVCKDCGKKFRSHAQAEFHASKTEHVNFDESTEEIAPLTEEEKKAKLEELRQKLALKRAGQADQDKIDKKRNEEISRKKTKDAQDIKEDLQKKEQIKEAAKKRQDKIDDMEAKKRIKAKIEADKEARRLKAEQEKAARAGQPIPVAQEAAAPAPKPAAPRAAASYTEARLRLQTSAGTLQKTFPAETTLFEVAQAISSESGVQVTSFTTNFPKKTYDGQDLGQTLKEAGLVPSAALIVR
ncbi:hypothetical protein K461DRAFT_277922 [Myriangium duriaei CBS 260.36]|uniref:UBX domain-containing protein n=1 Tax=Myriangium duriaei CBS 260.36 TaxID=1168546 RepID=A0A9P4MG33_9PEZI|nr:hypothetical protein K461DRAFT_277922 [Myriangium duriaei CBS 260.36]